MELRELLQNITPPDEAAREQAHRRWAACAKPLGSLGLLETALEDIAALTGDAQAPLLPRAVLVLCADNGVVAQGVTQTDSSVTAAVTRNLAAGRTSVCRMAQAAQCAVVPVDMGVRDFAPQPGVLARRIGNGTGDITQGPAMTRAQAEQAVLAGAELVRTQKEKGVRLLATGEMGIGNTTTASAVASVLLGRALLVLCALAAAGMAAAGGMTGAAMALAAVLVFLRYRAVAQKQFGGISGDLAGWFLQKAELWMLAALAACSLLSGVTG